MLKNIGSNICYAMCAFKQIPNMNVGIWTFKYVYVQWNNFYQVLHPTVLFLNSFLKYLKHLLVLLVVLQPLLLPLLLLLWVLLVNPPLKLHHPWGNLLAVMNSSLIICWRDKRNSSRQLWSQNSKGIWKVLRTIYGWARSVSLRLYCKHFLKHVMKVF